MKDFCNIPLAFSSSHHYSTNKADTSATISIRYNVTIAYTQKGDSDKPKTVEYVSKFLIMIPEELYNIYQIFLNKQIIEPGNILNQYIYSLYQWYWFTAVMWCYDWTGLGGRKFVCIPGLARVLICNSCTWYHLRQPPT